MKRYFYAEALEALYMEKYYKMRFQWRDFSEESLVDYDKLDGGAELHYNHDGQKRYYIHPDSLHLLEPQEYDFITNGSVSRMVIPPLSKEEAKLGEKYSCINDFWSVETARHFLAHGEGLAEIVQRGVKGKRFFWPQSEEV